MSSSVTNIKIEPANVFWQIEEQSQVTTVADVSSSLANKWFKLGAAGSSAYTHYVWLNLGSGTDPAPSGLTEIEVAVSPNATAAAVATAVAAAVTAIAGFNASASGAVVTIDRTAVGESAGVVDGTAATGFTFAQCQQGGDLDLGLLDGDIEVAFEEQLLEIMAHQTGTTVLADLRQGVSATVALTLKESDVAKLKEVFSKAAGGSYTPLSGTELFGWGTSKQGSNTVIQARRLVLHPVRLLAADYTEDLCFWKAYPLPESITFSGENPKVVSLSFKTYLDDSKDEAIKLFAFGDWSQVVPA